MTNFQPGSAAALALLNRLLATRGADTKAADAVFSMEGASGKIGDNGHAFGPGQENDAGGVWTGKYPGLTPEQKNAVAWSSAGLADLANRVAEVAAGKQGSSAINAIVTRFERPLNPGRELAGALAAYGKPGAATPKPIGGSTPLLQLAQKVIGGGNSSLSTNQLLALSLLNNGGTSGNDLLQLAMARQMLGGSSAPSTADIISGKTAGKAKGSARSLASATPGSDAGGFLPQGALYKPGRLDQGHDFQTAPGAPILAPGDGVVVAVKSDPNGFGPAYPIVHFTSGPYAGKDIYIGHTISQLQPGQKFTAGSILSLTGKTPIGNASLPGWAEIGFAPGALPGPDGQSTPF